MEKFGRVPTSLLHDVANKKLKPTCVVVYAVMASFSDIYGRVGRKGFMSQSEIALQSGLGRACVQRTITDLSDSGHLEKVDCYFTQSGNKGPRRYCRYRLLSSIFKPMPDHVSKDWHAIIGGHDDSFDGNDESIDSIDESERVYNKDKTPESNTPESNTKIFSTSSMTPVAELLLKENIQCSDGVRKGLECAFNNLSTDISTDVLHEHLTNFLSAVSDRGGRMTGDVAGWWHNLAREELFLKKKKIFNVNQGKLPDEWQPSEKTIDVLKVEAPGIDVDMAISRFKTRGRNYFHKNFNDSFVSWSKSDFSKGLIAPLTQNMSDGPKGNCNESENDIYANVISEMKGLQHA